MPNVRASAGVPSVHGSTPRPTAGSRRDAIRAAVLGPYQPPARLRPAISPERSSSGRRPDAPAGFVDPPPISTPLGLGHERLIDLEEVRARLGGIGVTLARRVLDELPVIRLGDRVLVRERSLDEYIRDLDAQARRKLCAR